MLVVGTCNKTELAVGFFVRHGDAAADIAPLALLYKTQVRQLAAHLGIPNDIIIRPPSPDLLPGLTDEQAMGLEYHALDRILWRLEKGMNTVPIAVDLGLDPLRVAYVEKLVSRAATLRAPARVPDVSENRDRGA
jgi:NAD+ synthase